MRVACVQFVIVHVSVCVVRLVVLPRHGARGKRRGFMPLAVSQSPYGFFSFFVRFFIFLENQTSHKIGHEMSDFTLAQHDLRANWVRRLTPNRVEWAFRKNLGKIFAIKIKIGITKIFLETKS